MPTDPPIQPLFNKEKTTKPLFAAPIPSPANNPAAFDRAHVEQVAGMRNEDFTVNQATEQLFRDLFLQERLPIELQSMLEGQEDLTPDEKTQRLLSLSELVDSQDRNRSTTILIQALNYGLGEANADTVLGLATSQLTAADTNRINNEKIFQQRESVRREVDPFVASQSGTFGELWASNAVQFIPVYFSFSKIGVSTAVMNALEIPKEGRPFFLLGNIRQTIRDTLTSQPFHERKENVKNVVQALRGLESDPILGPLITRVNLIDTAEHLLTDGVLSGQSSDVGWSTFFDNLSSVIDALILTAPLARSAGSATSRLFRSTDASTVRQTARAMGNLEVLQITDQSMARGSSSKFGVPPSEAQTVQMPRPAPLLNDRMQVAAPMIDDIQAGERIRDKIVSQSSVITGRGISSTDRNTAARKEISKLELTNNMEIVPGMSVISENAEATGMIIRQVIGRTSNSAWDSVESIVDDILELDPNLEMFKVMKVGPEGTLIESISDSSELIRIAASRDLSRLTNKQVIELSSKVEKDTEQFSRLEREAAKRAGDKRPPLKDQFYIQWDYERFYHPTDMVTLDIKNMQSGVIPNPLLQPSTKLPPSFYSAFLEAHLDESRLIANFEELGGPYHKLGVHDKKVVEGIFEWSNDFARRYGRAPSTSEMYSNFSAITPKQLGGLHAVRMVYDTMWELLNRRMYREFNGLNFKTARPFDPDKPLYHGKALKQEEVKSGLQAYDPETNQMVSVSKSELETIYRDGGVILELPDPIDIAGIAKTRASLIKIDGSTYEMGELSPHPLTYHNQYHMRFYKDPVYLVKSTAGVSINGVKQSSRTFDDVALMTAPTTERAERSARFIGRKNLEGENVFDVTRGGWVDPKDSDVVYKVVRAKDLDQTEGRLMQRQTLQTEGRLFWDNRNLAPLPNIHGTAAQLEDFNKSLEKGIVMMNIQHTQEDLMRGVRNALPKEFPELIDAGDIAKKNYSEIITALKRDRRAATSKLEKDHISKAVELVKYLRMMEGTNTWAVPAMREVMINAAAWTERLIKPRSELAVNSFRSIENFAAGMDPFKTMRSIAFNTLIVFNPIRQRIMQSLQLGYLTGLDPAYVASGKILSDAMVLRLSIARFTRSGFEIGFSDKNLATLMGLSVREHRKLVKEFERAGNIYTVGGHSFAGGGRRRKTVALPSEETAIKLLGYKGRQYSVEGLEWIKSWGFDAGEQTNITGSYLLAMRRVIRDKKHKTLLSLSPEDWKLVKEDASNMALGMIKPNNFEYQNGAWGVVTQFLSFQHKALLGILGKNPAISSKQAIALWVASLTLYGANFFGAREFVRELLEKQGVGDMADDSPSEALEATIVDILSAGLIQTLVNDIGAWSTKEWQDIDLSFIAPGFDVTRFYEQSIESIIKQPEKVFLGPFGNEASNFLTGLELANAYRTGSPDMGPGDKIIKMADAIARGTLPSYNNMVKSYMAYNMGVWFSQSKEIPAVKSAVNSILARGALGVRTLEQLALLRARRAEWESQEMANEIVKINQKALRDMINRWGDGDINAAEVIARARTLGSWMQDFPEGRKIEIYEASFLEEFTEGETTISAMLARMAKEQKIPKELLMDTINQIEDMSLEDKRLWKDLIDQAYSRKRVTEVEVTKRVQDTKEK